VKIHFDCSTRDSAQEAQLERTYEAAEVLRKAGFACEVTRWFVNKPGEDAAGIIIKQEPLK
jgi:hypothetical protein